jgi:hypothetical protein
VVRDDGLTSLREAVLFAKAQGRADRITFEVDVFDGEPQDMIRLVRGEIRITDALTIDGGAAGDDGVLDGMTDVTTNLEDEGRLVGNTRIFDFTRGRRHHAGRPDADRRADDRGRPARGHGGRLPDLTLERSTMAGNSASGDSADGGGVEVLGEATVMNSPFSGNFTSDLGADGVGLSLRDPTIVPNSTFSGTVAEGAGGAI